MVLSSINICSVKEAECRRFSGRCPRKGEKDLRAVQSHRNHIRLVAQKAEVMEWPTLSQLKQRSF